MGGTPGVAVGRVGHHRLAGPLDIKTAAGDVAPEARENRLVGKKGSQLTPKLRWYLMMPELVLYS
jgi:hypothetical protein